MAPLPGRKVAVRGPRPPRAEGRPRAAPRPVVWSPLYAAPKLKRYARHGGPSLRSPPLALRRRWRLGRASPPCRVSGGRTGQSIARPAPLGPPSVGLPCRAAASPLARGRHAPPSVPFGLVRRASPRLRGVVPSPGSAWLAVRSVRPPWGRPPPLPVSPCAPRRHRGSPQPPGGWGQSRRLRPSAAWPRSRHRLVAFGSRPSLLPPGAGAGQAPPFSGLRPRACPCRGKGQGRLSLGAERLCALAWNDVPPF